MHNLLKQIEAYLLRTGMKPSRFGRKVMGDPKFVFDLRDKKRKHKRIVRARSVKKILRFIKRGRLG